MRAPILLALAASACLAQPQKYMVIVPEDVPIRLSVKPSTATPQVGQRIDLVVTLIDRKGRPAAASGDINVRIVATLPSGAKRELGERISRGASSDTQSFTPEASGRHVIDVFDRAGKLLADSNSFWALPRNTGVQRRSAMPTKWWMMPSQPAWLAAKPEAPPDLEPVRPPARPAPLPVLHVDYRGGPQGVAADGNDAVKVSVIYDDGRGGAAPADIRIWFRISNGEIDKKPLLLAKNTVLAEGRWTSTYPIQDATIDYVSPKLGFVIDAPQTNKFDFIRQVVGMSHTFPKFVSIIERPKVAVQFVDSGLAVVGTREKRTVNFAVTQSGVAVEPATVEVEPGDISAHATLVPVSLGTSRIQIDSDNLIVGKVVADVEVGLGSAVLLSLLSGLLGGAVSWARDKKALALKLAGGVAGGLVLAAVYVFGLVPIGGQTLPLNTLAAIVVSLVGGFAGTAVLDWAWGKFSHA